jgi:hypothetical protein
MTKRCCTCKQEKDLSEFGKNLSRKDGLEVRCTLCCREHAKLNRLKSKAKNKPIIDKKVCPSCREEKDASCFGTNLGSKDGLRSVCKNCRNINARKKYQSDQRFRQKESIRHSTNLKYKEKNAERTKIWAKKNPDKILAKVHRRRARLYGQTEFDLPNDFIAILKTDQDNKCVYCSQNKKLTIDHIIPVCRGGKHNMDNIVLCCETCNFSKSTKTLPEWLEYNMLLKLEGVKSSVIDTICLNIAKMMVLKENGGKRFQSESLCRKSRTGG